MRDKIFRFFSFLLLLLPAATGAQEHQRLIVVPDGAGLTAVDPLAGRQRSGSIGAVAAFADRWRTELGERNVVVVADRRKGWGREALGDAIYRELVDSTLRRRMEREAGYAPEAQRDSLYARFGITPRAIDSLGEAEWLVVDRYGVEGHVAVRVRRFDNRSVRPSRRFEERFAEETNRLRRFFLTPVARLDTAITTRDAFFGPSAWADLFHRFQLETAPAAEVSCVAPPRLDASLSAGPVALGDFLRLFRFDNSLLTVRLTGQQLQEWMEKLFGMRFFRLEGPQSDLVRLRVPYYLHDDVAGLRFRVDLTARYNRRVTIYETERGEPFDPKRTYTVVLNSFRARDLLALEGVRAQVAAPDYRLALARWLLTRDTLRPRARDNWSAAPERWVRAIAARERRTIFDE